MRIKSVFILHSFECEITHFQIQKQTISHICLPKMNNFKQRVIFMAIIECYSSKKRTFALNIQGVVRRTIIKYDFISFPNISI